MQQRLSLSLADEHQRARIYAIRHQVYAEELGQHPRNDRGQLTDSLDAVNVYLVARLGEDIAGFVAITPPNAVGYSIDKYFTRSDVPVTFDDGLYVVRLLTVTSHRRASRVAAALMFAAWRYVQAQGGHTIVCIGRVELLGMYRRVGLRSLGRQARCGAVTYELMSGDLGDGSPELAHVSQTIERHVDWQVDRVSFHPPVPCYHGGAFFDAVGDEFDRLSTKDDVISAMHGSIRRLRCSRRSGPISLGRSALRHRPDLTGCGA